MKPLSAVTSSTRKKKTADKRSLRYKRNHGLQAVEFHFLWVRRALSLLEQLGNPRFSDTHFVRCLPTRETPVSRPLPVQVHSEILKRPFGRFKICGCGGTRTPVAIKASGLQPDAIAAMRRTQI